MVVAVTSPGWSGKWTAVLNSSRRNTASKASPGNVRWWLVISAFKVIKASVTAGSGLSKSASVL